jgi:anti-sigma factor RsiW
MTSGHEHERLPAFLDDELAPAERAEVAAHVAACAECAARLAELQAVDESVAALPSEAPAGYFESLPTRVRARLQPKAARRRLPVWTWAVAAALLLAVVTPLTLKRRPDVASGVLAPPIPAATPTLAQRDTSPREAPQAPSLSLGTPPQARPDALRAESREKVARPRPAPPLDTPALEERKREGFAAAPGEAGALAAGAPSAPAPLAAPAMAPAGREQELELAADAAAPPDALASSALRQAPALEQRAAAESADGAAPAAAAEPPPARGRVAATPVGASAAANLALAKDAEWQRLEGARPRDAAEWRRLREEWRRFVARDPDGPLADEARVRVIEAGHQAWRGANDPADEALFRSDAASYLERPDAAQKERVRRMLLR